MIALAVSVKDRALCYITPNQAVPEVITFYPVYNIVYLLARRQVAARVE